MEGTSDRIYLTNAEKIAQTVLLTLMAILGTIMVLFSSQVLKDFLVLRIETKALYMQGKCSTTKQLHKFPFFDGVTMKIINIKFIIIFSNISDRKSLPWARSVAQW